jgi:hypothetical protein
MRRRAVPQTVADTPNLLAIWDAAKNGQPPAAVPAHNYRPAWWLCSKGHSFQRPPRMMLSDPACPQCKVAGGTTSFADKYPQLAFLWHAEKNAELRPSHIDATYSGTCWWRCAKGHDFQRAPVIMVRSAECPTCTLAASSLAALYPTVAAEWHTLKNGDLKPDRIEADHLMSAWWSCPNGHEYQATIRARAKGGKRCPICFGGWSLDVIRDFVKSLLPHVQALNPSEKYALAMQAGLLREKDSRPFVKAFTSGKFPVEELEKFIRGEPSAIDDFARRETSLEPFVLEPTDGPVIRTGGPADPYTLPAAPEPEDANDIDVSREVDVVAATAAVEEESGDLPVVKASEALTALDHVLTASADAETVKFLLDSAKAKLWRHAYNEPKEARTQAVEFQGDVYSSLVRDRFLSEFDEAESLELPKGYAFRPRPGAPITPPNLMQCRVAVCVRQARRFGNWSGMGAGKTLSAILATRVVNAGLTVICCPNAVVETWGNEIQNAFSGCDVVEKTWNPTWKDPLLNSSPRYLVMNYEQFQLKTSEENLVAFLDENVVDFVVIDEIHYAKQRDVAAEMSKRKRLVQALVLEAAKKNADLCVLGMSGTPVINTLQEGKSLVELITGHRHDDLETSATVQNCMRLYQRLVTLGTRWKPDYPAKLDVTRIEIDCGGELEEIRRVGQGTTLELEQVLTLLRIPVILENIRPGEKVLIYSHFVDGIVKPIFDALKDRGLRAGVLTGETGDDDLKEFKKPDGKIDVLIASSRIATGVDGLQHVCNKLIINTLPWTNAEYEQLIGRLYRQGSKFDKVKVIIPVTFATVKGERWSYCESKLDRIEYKKSIADAAVDGVVPEGNLRTPAQAQQDIMSWLERLQDGGVSLIHRRRIEIPLSGEPAEVNRRVAAYGDFAHVNNRWYQSSSDKTHARLAGNPEEWAHYHTMYRELRKGWTVIPFEEEIRWLLQRDGLIVGDFGCGEAFIAERVKTKHVVHSFDHVAANPNVVACDVSAVPLDDGILDMAVFCLSLMGANFTDYLREAHRCLRLDGVLHVWEPASYFDDVDAFCRDLEKLGFDVMEPRTEGPFVRIYAVRNTAPPATDIVVRFRGKGDV